MDDRLSSTTEPLISERLRSLVEETRQGDASALLKLRTLLDEHPEIWRHAGDLSALVENTWIDVLAATNPLGVESLKRSMAEMRAELAGESPTPLERMLVDLALSSWLALKHAECMAADQSDGPAKLVRRRQQRVLEAHRRHLGAIKTLAEVRTRLSTGLSPVKRVKLFLDDDQQSD